MTARPAPLAISCKATHCGAAVPSNERRHSFTMPDELTLDGFAGTCRACRADVVNWSLCHARDPHRVQDVVSQLRKEHIRDAYWSWPLPDRITTLARRRSPADLRASGRRVLARELVPSEQDNPFLRMHTYYADHPKARIIHCAQHATATCCRSCLERWHGLPTDRALTCGELDYADQLTWLYTTHRLAVVTGLEEAA